MPRYTCKLCNKSFLVEENMHQHYISCAKGNSKPLALKEKACYKMLQALIEYMPAILKSEESPPLFYRFYRFRDEGERGPGYYLSRWYSNIIEDAFTSPRIYMSTLEEILKCNINNNINKP